MNKLYETMNSKDIRIKQSDSYPNSMAAAKGETAASDKILPKDDKKVNLSDKLIDVAFDGFFQALEKIAYPFYQVQTSLLLL